MANPNNFFKKGNRVALGRGSGQQALAKLEAALEKEGKARGVDFYDHVARQAYVDNTILKEVIKRFIPEKIEHSGDMTFNARIWAEAKRRAKEQDAANGTTAS
jgi:hypothetical protein